MDYLYLLYAQRVGWITDAVHDKHCRKNFGISSAEMRMLFALRRAALCLTPDRAVPLAVRHLRRRRIGQVFDYSWAYVLPESPSAFGLIWKWHLFAGRRHLDELAYRRNIVTCGRRF